MNVNLSIQQYQFLFSYKIPQGSHIELCPCQKVS
ncbi:hypothetical protein CPTAKMECS_186 [Salmonella phage vB_SenS-AKM_ECS]|uniref:Uncharacterized protein n=1 Tax=Salmonella phage vB_SenS-AKM_HA2021_32 TaxID=3158841 RepID=A0AAU7L2L6_9CAUD|nr:hypothetical protein CPTAKMECS_186 [Salmonella phage vB_SenS-AKM_ECS]